MSLAAPIGQARIRIRPDFAGFREEVRAEADSATAKPGTVKVTADTAEAKARMDALRLDLDRLRQQTATAKVSLDGDTKAQASLDRIDFSLRRLGTTTARPNVTLQGAERAKIQLDEIEARLRLVGATTARPRVVAGGSGGGLLDRLAGAGRSGGFFSPGGLAGLAVGLGSAAVPVGVAGLGLGASFLTPAVAGTAGLGLFGAASKSAVTRVSKVQTQLDALNKRIANTPQSTSTTKAAASSGQIAAAQARLQASANTLAAAQASGGSVASARAGFLSAQQSLSALQGRGGTTTKPNAEYAKLVKQRQQLLGQLTPAERAAAEGIEKFDASWKHFQRELEPETFKLLATGTQIFSKGLHDLLPMTKAVGDEVDHLAKRTQKALDDPFWQHFFGDFLTREAPRAVDSLGTTIGHVVTGIAHLAEQWAPLGHSLETEMVKISGNFEAWTQGQGPGAFMALVQRDGPIVGQALVAIGRGIQGIAKGVEPIGRIELQALAPVLNFIGDVGEQDPKVITALGVAYLTVAGGLKAIAAVKGLSGVIATIRGIGSGKSPGGVGGVGGVLGRGGNPAEPLYVFVVNNGVPGKEPVPGGKEPVPVPGKPSIFSRAKKILPGPLIYAETYAATAGGDQNPAQTPLGASRIRNGPAITSLIAGVGPRIPMNQGQDFFTGPLDQPGGRPVSPTGLVQNTLQFGTADQIKQLQDLAKTYPAISAALKDEQKQQNGLNKLLLVNPGLVKNVAAANKQLAASIRAAIADSKSETAHLGQDILEGLVAGMKHATPAAVYQAKLTTAQVIRQMRAEADAHSPSRATQRLGVDMGAGLAIGLNQGVTDNLAQADLAVAKLTQRIQMRLQVAKTQLAGDLSSRASLQSSLVASLLGPANLAGAVVNGRVGNLSAFLDVTAKPLGMLATDEAKLRRRHLDPYFLQQITEAGPDVGLALATNILSGKSGSIKHLNAIDKQLHSLARETAGGVAGAQFDTRIQNDRAQVQELIRATNANHAALQKLITAVKDNPHDFAAALDAVFGGAAVKHHARTSH